jgi:hypothetical protein
MTVFRRSFQVERLSDAVLKENGWLCDLLRSWHPSGDAIDRHMYQEGDDHLRLAIRDGRIVRLTCRDQKSPKRDARLRCRDCIPPFARRLGSEGPER